MQIREREETIADKEKRIYDLKKKNQELEKFKFVLDYKIKELKRQIEPRENEIADMRTQVEEMDLELEQYHKSNSALDLMIGELRLKMEGMQREISAQQEELANSQEYTARFRRDLEGATRYLDDYKMLKGAVRSIYTKYVQEQSGLPDGGNEGGGEMDAQMEYNRQREHLERNVEALKRKITKDVDMFMGDHARLMREGVSLTEEMNLLRREAKLLRRRAKSLDIEEANAGDLLDRASGGRPTPPTGSRGGGAAIFGARQVRSGSQGERELEMQEAQLAKLQNRAKELQAILGAT